LGSYDSISELKFYPIKNDFKQIVGVAVFSIDITEQKQSEELIRRNQQLLSSINRNIKEGLFRTSKMLGTVYVNQAFVHMFGFADEREAKAADYSEFFADEMMFNSINEELAKNKSLTKSETNLSPIFAIIWIIAPSNVWILPKSPTPNSLPKPINIPMSKPTAP
jgi:PAS domain-containing protein